MPVIQSQISPSSDAFRANQERMRGLLDDLAAKAATVERGGSDEARARHTERGKLLPRQRLAQLLDTGAPAGDSMVRLDGLETPVAPGSTVGGCMVVNCVKAEVAHRLTAAGHPPRVLTAAAVVGAERSSELFEAAYDEHGPRLAKLFMALGEQGKAT